MGPRHSASKYKREIWLCSAWNNLVCSLKTCCIKSACQVSQTDAYAYQKGTPRPFPFTVDVHEGFTLSPLLFILEMNNITRDFKQPAPYPVEVALSWCDDCHEKPNRYEESRAELEWSPRSVRITSECQRARTLEEQRGRQGLFHNGRRRTAANWCFQILGSNISSDGCLLLQ